LLSIVPLMNVPLTHDEMNDEGISEIVTWLLNR
jgi:hypothetical protein